METQMATPIDATQINLIQRKLYLESKIRAGAGWFLWIAALSILNTIIYVAGSSITFVVGLGATQIIDIFMGTLASEMGQKGQLLTYLGFVLDLAIAGAFIALGLLGRKRHRWAIILGMVLYAIDGAVLLLFGEYFGAAFHAWALFGIYGSLPAIKELNAMEAAGQTQASDALQQRLNSL